jgi:hypothetical protein
MDDVDRDSQKYQHASSDGARKQSELTSYMSHGLARRRLIGIREFSRRFEGGASSSFGDTLGT